MSTHSDHTPKYRHFKPKDLGVVRIEGKDFYLGKFGSPESWEKYHRLLAERFARGPAIAPNHQGKPQSEVETITELCIGYYRHAEKYYIKNGRPTSQVTLIKLALKTLRGLYGSTLAKDFGPLSLEAVRSEFVRQGLSRRECNRRTQLIKQAFKWGVSKELVPPTVWHGLQAVSGLAAGRTEAKDPKPIGPVPLAIVEQTIAYLTPTLEAMVRLQLAAAMRPGEVVSMRACDISMGGAIWEYRPSEFKTEHHEGSSRVIMLGPQAQSIIKPFLRTIAGHLFSPKQSELERDADPRFRRAIHERRRSKGKSGKPGKPATGDRWTVNTYRVAIAQACDAANPHPTIVPTRLTEEQAVELEAWRKSHRWHPNQLRHTAATSIRRKYGAEAAQVILGHAELSTTEIYAEKNLEAARRIATEIG